MICSEQGHGQDVIILLDSQSHSRKALGFLLHRGGHRGPKSSVTCSDPLLL